MKLTSCSHRSGEIPNQKLNWKVPRPPRLRKYFTTGQRSLSDIHTSLLLGVFRQKGGPLNQSGMSPRELCECLIVRL